MIQRNTKLFTQGFFAGIKGIIFDLDGTLLDSFQVAFNAFNEGLKRSGLKPVSEDFLYEFISENTPLDLILLRLLDDKDRLEEVRKNIYQAFKERGEKSYSLFPGALSILKKLKAMGFKIGIATGRTTTSKEEKEKLEAMGILPYVDAVVTSGDLGVRKPSPEIIRRCALLMDLKPSECMVVGDTASDVESAVSAGALPVFILRKRSFIREPPRRTDYILITTLKDVEDIINGSYRIRGYVKEGVRVSQSFLGIPWVKEQLIFRLGIDPFPGTFNLELRGEEISKWKWFRETFERFESCMTIEPKEEGFCRAFTAPARVSGKIMGFVLFPNIQDYPDSKMEIISHRKIREALSIGEGDPVEVEIILGRSEFYINKVKHIYFCIKKDVSSDMSTGFERFNLVIDSLPDVDYDEIDTSVTFLGKKLSAPLMISPMVGGIPLARKINRNLAKAAQELGIAMAVGSQRVGLEEKVLEDTYQVRDIAPDILLLSNLGAVYLNYGYGAEECKKAVEMIGSDGIMLYINPLQRIFRQKVECNFKGLFEKLKNLRKELNSPVVIREVGFGISPYTLYKLKELEIDAVDISGVGGTSWIKIESYISGKDPGPFTKWGVPTALALKRAFEALGRDIPIVASGGIRSGLDVAKAIALGARVCGIAFPLLKPAMESSELVKEKLIRIIEELKAAMFMCGVDRIEKLSRKHIEKLE